MANGRMYIQTEVLTYNQLCEQVIGDIRKLFLANQVREDGQVKRNPDVFTPWSARNKKYTLIDRQRMMPMVNKVAYLNDKNIWQFRTTDIRLIATYMRDEANRLDQETERAMLAV